MDTETPTQHPTATPEKKPGRSLKNGIFSIIKIVRIIAIGLLYYFASLVGALALACSDMKICEEYQLQFFIANTWLLVSFIFDFVQSFTLLNLSPTLRIFRMYKIVILIYIIILFSSFLF
jgi:hypothetical protein